MYELWETTKIQPHSWNMLDPAHLTPQKCHKPKQVRLINDDLLGSATTYNGTAKLPSIHILSASACWSHRVNPKRRNRCHNVSRNGSGVWRKRSFLFSEIILVADSFGHFIIYYCSNTDKAWGIKFHKISRPFQKRKILGKSRNAAQPASLCGQTWWHHGQNPEAPLHLHYQTQLDSLTCTQCSKIYSQ